MSWDILDGTELATWVQKLTGKGINIETHQMHVKWENLPIAPRAQTQPRGTRHFSLR